MSYLSEGGATSSLQPNLAAALSYFLMPISSIFFLLTEKNNAFVRFHAMQATIVGILMVVIYIVLSITFIGLILVPFLMIASFVLWIFLMYKAFNNEEYALPYVGEFARKQLTKI